MTLHTLPHISKETSPNPTFSIIWLHGLGADGHDFEPIVDALNLPKDVSIRFIFPHAPAMPVSLNGGYIMPAWYDIKQQDLGVEHDRDGVHHSAQQIQMLIDQEIMRGIPADHIILAGFSQGAAMSLYVGLRQPKPLGGIMVLSGYRLLPKEDAGTESCAEHTPVFIGHGIADSVVDIALGKLAYQYLTSQNMDVTWHDYRMQHSVCPEEIADIRAWLLQRFQALA
ncbi:MAG: carboxylesterase [Zetaproteobacteria bacterium]|nr:carboxylesterase [Zetaproteobacteria bacterium]